MDLLYGAFLGLVQGVGEFLPISSSGHLALIQNVLKMDDMKTMGDSALFSVLLHLATLVAVIAVYRQDVKSMLGELAGMAKNVLRREPLGENGNPGRRMILMILWATVPLVLVLPLQDALERLNDIPWFIGAALIVTGILLHLSDRMPPGKKTVETMTVWDAVVVGLAQVLAVIPGLSRSGTTIGAGMSRGFEREFSVRFSFLMSLLSVLGAGLVKGLDAVRTGVELSMLPVYLVGMATAGVTGYFSIRLLHKIVQKGRFGGFAYYCWAVGAVSILLGPVLGS